MGSAAKEKVLKIDFLGTFPYHDKKTAREVVGDHVVGHLDNKTNYVPNLVLRNCYLSCMAV